MKLKTIKWEDYGKMSRAFIGNTEIGFVAQDFYDQGTWEVYQLATRCMDRCMHMCFQSRNEAKVYFVNEGMKEIFDLFFVEED